MAGTSKLPKPLLTHVDPHTSARQRHRLWQRRRRHAMFWWPRENAQHRGGEERHCPPWHTARARTYPLAANVTPPGGSRTPSPEEAAPAAPAVACLLSAPRGSDRCEDGVTVTSVARAERARPLTRCAAPLWAEADSEAKPNGDAKSRHGRPAGAHQESSFRTRNGTPLPPATPSRTSGLGRSLLKRRGARCGGPSTETRCIDGSGAKWGGEVHKVGEGSATRRGPLVKGAGPQQGDRLSSRGAADGRPPGRTTPVRRAAAAARSPRRPGLPVRSSGTPLPRAPAESTPPPRPYPQLPATAAAAAMVAGAAVAAAMVTAARSTQEVGVVGAGEQGTGRERG